MDKRIKCLPGCLLLASLLIRAFAAAFTEPGNDEIYYVIYARFPALSHFDHPPMVGYFIQFFTLNLTLDSVFFIRLASVVTGTINTYLIYLIAKQLKDEYAGIYAALMYTASFYCFVICGIFIMPDTPLSFFWLLSLYFLLSSVAMPPESRQARRNILLAGVAIGLGMLSKYHAVFLWFGAALYILLYNRKWLRRPGLYISVILSLLIFSPVLIWNFQNGMVSFGFQGGRAAGEGLSFHSEYLLTELAGEFFYVNPVNFLIIIFALVGLFRYPGYVQLNVKRLLFLTSLPLILVFVALSCFSQGLPHWAAPGYTGLMIIGGIFLSHIRKPGRIFPRWIVASVIFMILVLTIALAEIKTGIIPLGSKSETVISKGRSDITLDMYGWKRMAEHFGKVAEADRRTGRMGRNVFVVSYRWFPAAHQDYYFSGPNGMKTYVWGTLERIHEFHWTNIAQGEPDPGSDAYFISTSRDFTEPTDSIRKRFYAMEPADTFAVMRCGKPAEYMFIYRLRNLLP